MKAAAIRIVVGRASCSGSADPNGRYAPAALGFGGGQLAAGSTFTLDAGTLCTPSGGTLALSTATVTVAWVGPEGGSSQLLYRWHGPSA